jgi:hypothetical protein
VSLRPLIDFNDNLIAKNQQTILMPLAIWTLARYRTRTHHLQRQRHKNILASCVVPQCLTPMDKT